MGVIRAGSSAPARFAAKTDQARQHAKGAEQISKTVVGQECQNDPAGCADPCGSLSTWQCLAATFVPPYAAYLGYMNEASAVENGCGFWQSFEIGITQGGPPLVASGLIAAGPFAETASDLAAGWRGTNMTDQEAFAYHYATHGDGLTPLQYAQEARAWAANPSGPGTRVQLADGSWGIRYRTPGGGSGGILDSNGNIVTFWTH